jgi:sugar-specific transcriptional regulator TrmB
MAKSFDELIPLFKGLGITEYEAKVYLSLLSSHPASAYTISQHSGVPHSRVYDVTRRLIERGLVASTGTKPEMFSALAPEAMVDKLETEYKQYTQELERHIREFDFSPDFDPVWNLTNREDVMSKVVSAIEKAQRRIFIGVWDAELPEVEPQLRRAHERGVNVYMLLYGEAVPDFGTVYTHSTEQMPRYDELGRTLDCTVDSSWCITGVLGNTAPCRVMWSQNRGLVLTIESYIKHDFYLAELYSQYEEDVERLYGKNLSALRRKFDA